MGEGCRDDDGLERRCGNKWGRQRWHERGDKSRLDGIGGNFRNSLDFSPKVRNFIFSRGGVSIVMDLCFVLISYAFQLTPFVFCCYGRLMEED